MIYAIPLAPAKLTNRFLTSCVLQCLVRLCSNVLNFFFLWHVFVCIFLSLSSSEMPWIPGPGRKEELETTKQVGNGSSVWDVPSLVSSSRAKLSASAAGGEKGFCVEFKVSGAQRELETRWKWQFGKRLLECVLGSFRTTGSGAFHINAIRLD